MRASEGVRARTVWCSLLAVDRGPRAPPRQTLRPTGFSRLTRPAMKSSLRHRRRWFGWARGELSKPGDEKRSKSKLTPPTSAEDLPLVGNVADELPPTPGSPAMPSLPTSHSPENLPDSEIESLRHVVGLLLPLVRVSRCVVVFVSVGRQAAKVRELSPVVKGGDATQAIKSRLAPGFTTSSGADSDHNLPLGGLPLS
jgi:hypothetical protein